ncbi:hypothetical protein [Maribacter sp. 2307ULW6-5]|uniref:hypothetical protein n=1 Tax=Maribacter sp. 2307ULW6-5 TaxID=3386275 RepID=UPI0039BC32FC
MNFKIHNLAHQLSQLLPLLMVISLLGACQSGDKKGNRASSSKETVPEVKNRGSKEGTVDEDMAPAHARRKHIPNITGNGTTGGNMNILNETTDSRPQGKPSLATRKDALNLSPEQEREIQNALNKLASRAGAGTPGRAQKTVDKQKDSVYKLFLTAKQWETYRDQK